MATPLPRPTYDDLVSRAERGDTTLNYTDLRLAYAQSDSYDPYARKTRAFFDAAWRAFQAKDCTTALEQSAALLKINYISIPMHVVRSDCLKQSGDQTGSDRELAIGRGLAASLLASGDGQSTSTAYVVVTLSEEGFVLSDLGFSQEKQSLIMGDSGHFDLITGHDNVTGKERSAFFRIDAIFAGVQKMPTKPPSQ